MKQVGILVVVCILLTILPVNAAAGAMSTLHVHAWSVFRDVITDALHEAMEPDIL